MCAQGCGSRVTCHPEMLQLTLDPDQANSLLQGQVGTPIQRGWGTPGCPAPYLGVHAEEVVRSPAAQRGALKRLAVVKVVVVFQASNLQKKEVVWVVFFKVCFPVAAPPFCTGSISAAVPCTPNLSVPQSSQGWGGCRMLAPAPVPPL